MMAVAATTVALGAVAAGPASAVSSGQNPRQEVTSTYHQHGTFTDTATNPCTGAPGTATFDGNAVLHVTNFAAGDDVSATHAETGKVTVTWDGVTYSGSATAVGHISLNPSNVVSTSTLIIRVFAADGSSVTGHEVTYFRLNTDRTAVIASFDKVSFTCT